MCYAADQAATHTAFFGTEIRDAGEVVNRFFFFCCCLIKSEEERRCMCQLSSERGRKASQPTGGRCFPSEWTSHKALFDSTYDVGTVLQPFHKAMGSAVPVRMGPPSPHSVHRRARPRTHPQRAAWAIPIFGAPTFASSRRIIGCKARMPAAILHRKVCSGENRRLRAPSQEVFTIKCGSTWSKRTVVSRRR